MRVPMQFNDVETCPIGAFGSLCKVGNQLLDLFHRHFARFEPALTKVTRCKLNLSSMPTRARHMNHVPLSHSRGLGPTTSSGHPPCSAVAFIEPPLRHTTDQKVQFQAQQKTKNEQVTV
jgi:hypothetical protein